MWKSRGSNNRGLEGSIARLGRLPSGRYFTYLAQSSDWFEGVEFAIEAPEGEEAVSILLYKKFENSKEFHVEMSYYLNGNLSEIKLDQIPEQREYYEGVTFNTFLNYYCLARLLRLKKAGGEHLDEGHVAEIDEAIAELKTVLETSILMRTGLEMSGFNRSGLPEMIEQLYKAYELKGVFGEEIFP